jgi:hypothetical protein
MGYEAICANDENRSQLGATDRPENIAIRCLPLVYLHLKWSMFSVFIYRFFTGLSLRLLADMYFQGHSP